MNLEDFKRRVDQESRVIAAAEESTSPQTSEAPSIGGEAAIERMNAIHFVVSAAGKTVVITEEQDPVLKRRVLLRSSFEDIRNLYNNQRVALLGDDGRPQSKPLGHYWLDHPKRRQYPGMVCAPGEDAHGYFNLWQGFSVKEKAGDWSLMQGHIRDNICAGNPEVYGYILKWLAFAVQRPGTVPEVALVLRGKQGTGKGIFVRGFGDVFGDHFLHISHARHLAGNFNAHLEDAVVVYADEAFLVGDKQAEGTLKMLVTEPDIVIEGKGRDVTRARNLIHLIIASNSEWIIRAAAEERRFLVLDVGDAHLQDLSYFGAIVEQMKNGGREAMLYDLMHEDLSGFNVRQIPATAALQDQKLQSMTAVEKWWLEKLTDGRLLFNDESWTTEVVKEDLVSDYYVSSQRNLSAQELRHQLVKLLPDGFPKDGKRPNRKGIRVRTWTLPNLGACRTTFDKHFRTKHPWPVDAEVSDQTSTLSNLGKGGTHG